MGKCNSIETILNKTEMRTGSGCLYWLGYTNSEGYGRLSVKDKMWLVHRYMYTELVGEIKDDLTVDHLCKTPNCINVNHMELVSASENVKRGIPWNSKKTHCPRGHPYKGNNLYITKEGFRQCKKCQRLRQKNGIWKNDFR